MKNANGWLGFEDQSSHVIERHSKESKFLDLVKKIANLPNVTFIFIILCK